MLIDSAALLQQTEDRGDLIAVFSDKGAHAVGQHSRNILIETAAGHMAAALDLYAGLTHTAERAHIDLGGTEQGIAQRLAQFRIELAEVLFIYVKDLADQ